MLSKKGFVCARGEVADVNGVGRRSTYHGVWEEAFPLSEGRKRGRKKKETQAVDDDGGGGVIIMSKKPSLFL